jgi:lipopolysaccharide export LptBFGC system permease protein LptF
MILQRYIFREVFFAFLFTFAAVMAVFLVGATFQVFRAYSSIGLGTLLRIIPLVAAGTASWAILISVPPAATLVYGRLSADNEIDAMRISGIATWRMVAPGLFFSLFACMASYAVVEHAAPAANYAKRMLTREFSIELLKSPPPGVQHFPFGQFELTYFDCTGGLMRLPHLTQYVNGLPQTVYSALSGRAIIEEGKPVRIAMNRWTSLSYDKSGRETLASAENEALIDLPLDDFMQAGERPDNLSGGDLWDLIWRTPRGGRRTWMLTTYYSRFAQGLAPLALVLVSVPIGIFVRRGSRLAGLGTALPPLLLYIVAFFIFQGMGENERVMPRTAAFAPDAILAVLGSGLLWTVCRK